MFILFCKHCVDDVHPFFAAVFVGAERKSPERQVQNSILHVNRLWEPAQEIPSFESSKKSYLSSESSLALSAFSLSPFLPPPPSILLSLPPEVRWLPSSSIMEGPSRPSNGIRTTQQSLLQLGKMTRSAKFVILMIKHSLKRWLLQSLDVRRKKEIEI